MDRVRDIERVRPCYVRHTGSTRGRGSARPGRPVPAGALARLLGDPAEHTRTAERYPDGPPPARLRRRRGAARQPGLRPRWRAAQARSCRITVEDPGQVRGVAGTGCRRAGPSCPRSWFAAGGQRGHIGLASLPGHPVETPFAEPARPRRAVAYRYPGAEQVTPAAGPVGGQSELRASGRVVPPLPAHQGHPRSPRPAESMTLPRAVPANSTRLLRLGHRHRQRPATPEKPAGWKGPATPGTVIPPAASPPGTVTDCAPRRCPAEVVEQGWRRRVATA